MYSTQEPMNTFHRRIDFSLKTHNEAVKAMRYPPNLHKKSGMTDSTKERRELEEELVKGIEDEEDEF